MTSYQRNPNLGMSRYNPKLWIGSVKKAAYPFA